MDHVSYEKMPHSSARWKFAGSANNPSRVKWCVTEKCHGANFVFHCDGHKIFHGKRTSLISSNDSFFGYKSMTQKLNKQILNLYNCFIQNKSFIKRYVGIHHKKNNHNNVLYQLHSMSIYGELFGGFYPIPNKKKNDNDIKANEGKESDFVVQREILYSPNIEFYAFDIAIVLKDMNSDQTRRQYINYEDAICLFDSAAVGIFYAKPLFIGKYEDCCHYNYEFQSNIPKWLGLPPLPKEYGQNLAEGIVIKPMKNIYIQSKGKKLKRPIVKHKHKAFNERISTLDKKYGKSNKMKGKDMINIECLLNMINNIRYQSVVSKHGNPSWNQKSSKKKKRKKYVNSNAIIDKKIDGDNFYVKAILDDVYDDIKSDKGSVIYDWWNKNVIMDHKLMKYIHNKMLEKSIQIVFSNKL